MAAVAAVAGVVSYAHIVALGMRTHQGVTDSHLLPIPIDGLIVAGSFIIMAGSWLGWAGVALGVAGTLFANLEFGLPYGPLPAIVSTWPAIAFTVATWMLERWLKRQVGRGSTMEPRYREVAEIDTRVSISEPEPEPVPATDDQCPHGVATSAEEAVVTAFLHGRDCLGDEPSQRYLAARFGMHRTVVARLVVSLNGSHSPDADSEVSALAP